MAFTTRRTGDTINASDVQNVYDAWQGVAGAAVAMQLTQLNDSGNWSLKIKNLDSTYSYGLLVQDSTGKDMFFVKGTNVGVAKSLWIEDSYGSGTTLWPLEIVPTFNDSGTTFTAFHINITDTVSAASSLIAKWQVDSNIKFQVALDGRVAIANSLSASGLVYLDHAAYTATAATNIARLLVENTNAITIPAGTTAIAASVYIAEPNLTATGTVTDAVTLFIEGAPTEGGTGNYSLWVDAGNVRFDANIYTGAYKTFATTQPTMAHIFDGNGTAPVGAITTASAIFASTTVMRKIIADSTVSNIES